MDRLSGRETCWTFGFLGCLSSKDEVMPPRASAVPSILRDMNVYQQPHLVEPMKLRIYEDLPATPDLLEHSQWTRWSKTLASRASSRASKISLKRRTGTKSIISKPQPMPGTSDDLPLRRRRSFSPMQLSIYRDSQRLSDLPEFDRFSFTEQGELKRPPKALVRAHSEDILRTHQRPTITIPKRINSMVETSDSTYNRPGTSCSIISTSRPPSEYDALHSHPVSSASLSGVTITQSHKSGYIVDVLTPMQEEFSPIATAITVDGTVLNFPKPVRQKPAFIDSDLASVQPEAQAPYPVIYRGPSSVSSRPRRNSIRPYNPSSQSHKRVSQWLHYRSRSSSSSTVATTSTGASFAEHRRKRSDFYKLGQQTQISSTIPASPPQPLNFSRGHSRPRHQRTDTESTSNTVSTSILSTVFDGESHAGSEESMTECSVADIKSRTGTVKSVTSPAGLKIITPEVHDAALPPALSGQIINPPRLYLDEINGPLRSPGVGVAF